MSKEESIVENYRKELLKERESDLWVGYVNMLKTIKSLFVSPNHWVLEFIQNAEDARSERVLLSLENGFLTILNNGKPFDKEDFRAICNVNSSKRPSSGQLGYLGIGFKSIFKVCDCVEIHSGDYHFKFDKGEWRHEDSSKFPWEILPVETKIQRPPEPYTTQFNVFIKSDEIKEEIQNFLGNFPSEIILFLKNIKEIKIKMKERIYIISKRILEEEATEYGRKEKIAVEDNGHLAYYLVFRKTIKVPEEVRKDEETERCKRSDITEREIGLVFKLDENNKLKRLSGKVSGVYSFLPVEGEQTGLPFGIYGDFIPNPGRDLINYEALWNKWMRDEVIEFFKDVVEKVFAPHDEWCFFIEELKGRSTSQKFWDEMGGKINAFIEDGPFYPDIDGKRCRKNELFLADDEIVELFGRDKLEKTFEKKLGHPGLKGKISLQDNIDIYYLIQNAPRSLEELKDEPEKIRRLYHKISELSDYYIRGRKYDMPFYNIPFVLAEDGGFYEPKRVVSLEINAEELPGFLKALFSKKEKKILHPVIAKDEEAVDQLKRCGLESINRETILKKLANQIRNIKSREDLPADWNYNDLIEATLFLIKEEFHFELSFLLAEDNIMIASQNLFLEGAPLNWAPVWREGLLPGFKPLHRGYLDETLISRYGLSREKVIEFLRERTSIHGFDIQKDKSLIEKVAIEKAKKELKGKGHNPQDVSDRDRLGYDLACPHCGMAIEVKGMKEPKDIELQESEVRAAKERGERFKLIIVYNIPDEPSYLERNNLKHIWEPVEKARIPKEKWLG